VPVEDPYPDEDSHWSGGVEPDEKLKAVPVEDPYPDEDSHWSGSVEHVEELKAVPVEDPCPDEDSHWSSGVQPGGGHSRIAGGALRSAQRRHSGGCSSWWSFFSVWLSTPHHPSKEPRGLFLLLLTGGLALGLVLLRVPCWCFGAAEEEPGIVWAKIQEKMVI
jgi:hypothetical protein